MSKIYLLMKHTLILQVECYCCEFEDACIKAFVEAFSDGATECCFFHLVPVHWRKIMDMGLRTRYIEDETLSLNLRMFTALAFVPPDDIVSVFNELKENAPEEAQSMILYLDWTYVGSTTYASHGKPDGTMVPNRTHHTTECSPFHCKTLLRKNIVQILVEF